MRGKSSVKKREYLKRFRKTPYPQKQGMSEQDTNANGDIIKDFQSTGRTGRRNAMADVLGAHKDVSTADLPLKLEKLSTRDLSTSVPECSTTKRNNCISISEAENTSEDSPSSASTS